MKRKNKLQGKRTKAGVVIIHGVADTKEGANLETLAQTIGKHASGFRIEKFDRVNEEEDDPKFAGTEIKYQIRAREGTSLARPFTFAEVYWADTTRVETSKSNALLAAFRIVFEAHYLLDALIDRSKNWLLKFLFYFLLSATALIRGPVAALNIVAFALGSVYLFGQSVLMLTAGSRCFEIPMPKDCAPINLHWMVLAMLALIFVASLYYFVKSRRRADLAFMEVFFATAVVSLLLILFHLGAMSAGKASATAAEYTAWLYGLIMLAWRCVVVLVTVAVPLTVLSWIYLTFTASDAYTQIRRSILLALGLAFLQASLWTLFLSVPAVPLIVLGKFVDIVSTTPPNLCPLPMQAYLSNAMPEYLSTVAVNFVCRALPVDHVILAFIANLGGFTIVVVTAGLIWLARSAIKRGARPQSTSQASTKERERLRQVAARMPRLVISGWILASILVAAGVITYVNTSKLAAFQTYLSQNLLVAVFLVSLLGFVVVALYTALDKKFFVNFIHIARDLIDHQYRPELSFVYFLLPERRKRLPEYPRRMRLLARVDAVVTKLKEKHGCKKFVFVAHSQGSVIVFDYLKRLKNSRTLEDVSVVTFGSPVDHLYRHYFHEYANADNALIHLSGRTREWTNLFRIDDPIGSRIEGPAPWMRNIEMTLGGHTKYWQEAIVAQTIAKSIRGGR